MDKLRAIISDIGWNLNSSTLPYTLHRVTGIALVLFLFLHIWTLSAVFQGSEAFNKAVGKFDNPLGHLMEYTLFFAVMIHLLNGLRITLVELFDLTALQERLLWGSLGVLLVAGVYSVTVLFLR
ncbi:MAG TPA: succinate dehydrogenase, cytochrome b556 subunit [Candidatus Hypogeohydataceae bacterium YC38]|nr:succinate dehydrogenase, cytochrome b556 subunit [Candidatus Brocadiales bacterium]